MLVRRFGKKLKSELKPLKKSTELIISRDLDFEVVPTNIKEFNEILTSIDNMKSHKSHHSLLSFHKYNYS